MSLPPALVTIEDRATACGLSLARLGRLAAVPYRHIFEGNLNSAELEQIDAVLMERENPRGEGDK